MTRNTAMAAEANNAAVTLLTAETVPGYLVGRGVFGSSSAGSVTAKAIVGGNINYAFQVSVSISKLNKRYPIL